MSPEEHAQRVAEQFRTSPDRSARVLMQLVAAAIREAVLEERHVCLRAMYAGLDLGKVERAIMTRPPHPGGRKEEP